MSSFNTSEDGRTRKHIGPLEIVLAHKGIRILPRKKVVTPGEARGCIEKIVEFEVNTETLLNQHTDKGGEGWVEPFHIKVSNPGPSSKVPGRFKSPLPTKS